MRDFFDLNMKLIPTSMAIVLLQSLPSASALRAEVTAQAAVLTHDAHYDEGIILRNHSSDNSTQELHELVGFLSDAKVQAKRQALAKASDMSNTDMSMSKEKSTNPTEGASNIDGDSVLDIDGSELGSGVESSASVKGGSTSSGASDPHAPNEGDVGVARSADTFRVFETPVVMRASVKVGSTSSGASDPNVPNEGDVGVARSADTFRVFETPVVMPDWFLYELDSSGVPIENGSDHDGFHANPNLFSTPIIERPDWHANGSVFAVGPSPPLEDEGSEDELLEDEIPELELFEVEGCLCSKKYLQGFVKNQKATLKRNAFSVIVGRALAWFAERETTSDDTSIAIGYLGNLLCGKAIPSVVSHLAKAAFYSMVTSAGMTGANWISSGSTWAAAGLSFFALQLLLAPITIAAQYVARAWTGLQHQWNMTFDLPKATYRCAASFANMMDSLIAGLLRSFDDDMTTMHEFLRDMSDCRFSSTRNLVFGPLWKFGDDVTASKTSRDMWGFMIQQMLEAYEGNYQKCLKCQLSQNTTLCCRNELRSSPGCWEGRCSETWHNSLTAAMLDPMKYKGFGLLNRYQFAKKQGWCVFGQETVSDAGPLERLMSRLLAFFACQLESWLTRKLAYHRLTTPSDREKFIGVVAEFLEDRKLGDQFVERVLTMAREANVQPHSGDKEKFTIHSLLNLAIPA